MNFVKLKIYQTLMLNVERLTNF